MKIDINARKLRAALKRADKYWAWYDDLLKTCCASEVTEEAHRVIEELMVVRDLVAASLPPEGVKNVL